MGKSPHYQKYIEEVDMEHKGTKNIKTERLFLRQFNLKDADSCLKNWASDPDVYRYMSQNAQTETEVRDWLSTADQAYKDLETYYWAIIEASTKEVIGEIFVDDFGTRNCWCELDWKIGKGFWNKGYMTEAVKAVSCYLIEEIGFHRVQAKCCVENRASERVMQKSGMTKDGVLRGYFYCKDNRFCDVVMYAILADD